MNKSNIIHLRRSEARDMPLTVREPVQLGLFDPGTADGRAQFVAACREAARKEVEED